MEALDLRTRPPRSPYEMLDGLMLMPRTIDKLRAQLPGGNPGVYYINGPIKGISGYLLERLGIEEGDLREAVRNAGSEDDVAAWVRAHTDASQYPAINDTLRRLKPKHAQNEEWLRNEYAATLAEHPELEFLADILDADDRRLYPTAFASGRNRGGVT